MDFHVDGDRGTHGFSWVLHEPMQRASHVLADDGRVWLVDPVDRPAAVERALALGRPAAVVQLLDRHRRDCAALAERLGVPLLVAPDAVPDSPFEAIAVKRWSRWRESALWWPAQRTLVVADALSTTRFSTGGRGRVGVHLLLRLTPPRMLAGLHPEHLLVGHGDGVHTDVERAIGDALRTSRRGLLRVLLHLPFSTRTERSGGDARG